MNVFNEVELDVMESVFGFCLSHTCTAEIVFNIYKTTFESAYAQGRSNYGIFIHGQSLDNQVEVDGLNAFLIYAKSAYPDTFVVKLSQIIDFEKNKPPQTSWNKLYASF